MSLRVFHLVFIVLSILLSVGLGSWGLRSYLLTGALGPLALGAIFFVIGFVLVLYARRFLKKMREIEA